MTRIRVFRSPLERQLHANGTPSIGIDTQGPVAPLDPKPEVGLKRARACRAAGSAATFAMQSGALPMVLWIMK